MTNESIQIICPDDWHLHLRDGAVLNDVVPDSAQRFARAIIMPNLKPPITTVPQALAYHERILAAVPAHCQFNPLMTLYLTDNTAAEEIHAACNDPHVYAVKYYPAGATTHSDAGVTRIEHAYNAIEAMAECGLPLLIHGEVTAAEVDVFDREAVFIDSVLIPLLQRFPTLRVVLEHITTRQAVEFIRATQDNIAATITPHHLLMNRNAMFEGGIIPHHYCLPILKREQHRQALLQAATSGEKSFFLGTDSAPHARTSKESACGCAGIYSAHAAIELYAEAFDECAALPRLEGFASRFGPEFYRLPLNLDHITLIKEDWRVAEQLRFSEHTLVPLRAGKTIKWKLQEPSVAAAER